MTIRRTITVAAALGVLTTACGTSDDTAGPGPTSLATTAPSVPNVPLTASAGDSSQPSVSTVATTASTLPGNPTSTASTTVSTTAAPEAAVDGQTIVRFSAGDTHLDVTVRDDNATIRDFLSMLPLTLRFEEFNGREKISYLPRSLDTTATAGSDPEDGDLIYYAPWGNLGFYYNTAGIGFSDDVIHLGTYSASADELTALEAGEVTVNIVQ